MEARRVRVRCWGTWRVGGSGVTAGEHGGEGGQGSQLGNMEGQGSLLGDMEGRRVRGHCYGTWRVGGSRVTAMVYYKQHSPVSDNLIPLLQSVHNNHRKQCSFHAMNLCTCGRATHLCPRASGPCFCDPHSVPCIQNLHQC